MSGEETENDTTKAIAALTTSVKAIQEELKTIKSGATDSSVNSQSGMKRRATNSGIIPYAGSQDSNLASSQDLPAKRPRMAESDTEELKDDGEPQDEVEDQLVTLSEVASTFLETAFKSKIDNSARTKLRNLEYQTHDGPDAQRSMQLYRQISLETLRELIVQLSICSNFGWMPWLQS